MVHDWRARPRGFVPEDLFSSHGTAVSQPDKPAATRAGEPRREVNQDIFVAQQMVGQLRGEGRVGDGDEPPLRGSCFQCPGRRASTGEGQEAAAIRRDHGFEDRGLPDEGEATIGQHAQDRQRRNAAIDGDIANTGTAADDGDAHRDTGMQRAQVAGGCNSGRDGGEDVRRQLAPRRKESRAQERTGAEDRWSAAAVCDGPHDVFRHQFLSPTHRHDKVEPTREQRMSQLHRAGGERRKHGVVADNGDFVRSLGAVGRGAGRHQGGRG